MKDFQTKFISYSIECGILQFGEFKLKSGRISPYFFNTGLFNSGARLTQLGQFYADAIIDSQVKFDLIYGPAYKGIPIVCATSMALSGKVSSQILFAFNRKESKDHGEGGMLVGSAIKGKVLIVDDVISAGTSVQESVNIIRRHNGIPAGVVVSLDRQEKGQNELSAIDEVKKSFGIDVISIITLNDIIEFLKNKDDMKHTLSLICNYHKKYGITP